MLDLYDPFQNQNDVFERFGESARFSSCPGCLPKGKDIEEQPGLQEVNLRQLHVVGALNKLSALETALLLARSGIKTFPACLEGGNKKSYLKEEFCGPGEKWGMSNDPKKIQNRFNRRNWRDKVGVGIPTGEVNSVWVIEADTPKGHGVDGLANLKALQVKHGELPDTLMARSPTGSVHRYYKYPPGVQIKSGALAGYEGVDIKATGGMVIAPTSVRPGKGQYVWLNALPIADAPAWLLELVRDDAEPKSNGGDAFKRVGLPDIGEVAAALEVIPPTNDELGREWFVTIGHAVHAATEGSDEGLELFDKWRQRGPYYDADKVSDKWKGFRRTDPPEKPITFGTLAFYADQADPSWRERITDKDDEQDEAMLLASEPFDFPAEETLEQYDWMLGRHLLRGEVAGSAATGGTGKSLQSIIEALAMASGKKLTYDDVPSEPLRVVLINLEDTRNTMNKRITAAMKHYKLTKKDVGDRLFSFAKGELSFKIATEYSGKVKRNQEAIDALTKFMIEKKGDVLSIDSLIRTHGVNENFNTPMEQVVECYEEIAHRAKCGVHLWHHNRKGKSGEGETTVESARGAQAFIDACRSVRILETMSKADARKLGVEDEKHHRRYFRVFSGKRNFAPHIEDSNWFYIASVTLNNAPAGSLLDGDSIGVVETWDAEEAQKLAQKADTLRPWEIDRIKEAVAKSEWREDARAGMWVGRAIAPVLGLDPDDDQEKVKRVIKQLIKDGVLKTIPGRKEDRKPCLFVVPGDWKAPVVELAERRKQREGAAPVEPKCETCGRKLKGKQKRFCSHKCRQKNHRK